MNLEAAGASGPPTSVPAASKAHRLTFSQSQDASTTQAYRGGSDAGYVSTAGVATKVALAAKSVSSFEKFVLPKLWQNGQGVPKKYSTVGSVAANIVLVAASISLSRY